MAKDNKQIAADVLAAIGGPENVKSVLHCMTRLRFNLVDESIVDDDKVKAVNGAMGIAKQGGQYQVIIGTNVPEVYDAIVASGVSAGGSVDEDAGDVEKKPLDLSPKGIMDAVLNYLSGSVVPLIPVLIVGGLFRTLYSLLGPTLLNVVAEDSSFMFLCNMVFTAAFYFMPIVAGFAAAKKLDANPYLGAFMGAILMEPSYVALAGVEGATFSVYGIPAPILGYAQTLIPVLLCVAVMAPIERFLEAKLPASIRTIFAPFFTFVIMMPIALCVLAPLGHYVGDAIAGFFFWIADTPLGFLATTIIAATWGLLVLTGMHLGLAAIALAQFAQTGVDNLVLMAATVQAFTATAAGVAVWLRLKDPEQKNLALGYVITQFIGGVGEPLLYGIVLRYKRPWIGIIAGGAASGLYAALTGVVIYSPAQGLFSFLNFAGGTQANFVNGIIAMIIGIVVSFVVTYLFGITKEQAEGLE